MEKIMVIGSTGSGKSTLAGAVAVRLGLPYTPTDPLYWGKGWRRVPSTEVCQRVMELTAEPQWVLDGNFDDAYELVWARADTLV